MYIYTYIYIYIYIYRYAHSTHVSTPIIVCVYSYVSIHGLMGSILATSSVFGSWASLCRTVLGWAALA